MSTRPWMKWYPSDWRADPALRMCSLTARGLWIELLGFMHESAVPGHFLINGSQPDHVEIASLVASNEKTVAKCMEELERRGVFSKTENGIIFSRRMCRDFERSDEGRQWIAKRWEKVTQPNSSTDSPPNSPPNRGPKAVPSGDPITQKPEARSQKVSKKLPPFYELDGVAKCPDTGRDVVNGYYLDTAVEGALGAAKMTAGRRLDYQPLIQWLAADIPPATIRAAIARVAERRGYVPPASFRYFDSAVREQPREMAA